MRSESTQAKSGSGPEQAKPASKEYLAEKKLNLRAPLREDPRRSEEDLSPWPMEGLANPNDLPLELPHPLP